jgi:starch-binding outer membrane protein SusE/F
MKANFKIAFLLGVASMVLGSCEKEETRAVLNPGGSIVLTSTQNTLVLTQPNAANNAVIFSWGAASFGYDAAITYSVQLAKAGTNFASPATTTEVNVGTALTKTFTVGDFNAKMQEIINDGVATGVEARIKADVGSGVTPIYSNVIAMTVTSYLDIVTYAYPAAMNIAGNFQGWDPPTAPQIVNTRNGGYAPSGPGTGYEGYIIFNNATPFFKIVKGNNWGAGDYGGSGGTLTNGGSDISLPSGGAGIAGLYRLRANPTAMTYSFDKINTWGIIGNATPGGWGASTAMTFSPSNGSWTITANLVVGEMKFRANDDWPINFGDNTPADGKPEYDGNNIPVTVAGNYTITLNIGIGGNYTYKLKKN